MKIKTLSILSALTCATSLSQAATSLQIDFGTDAGLFLTNATDDSPAGNTDAGFNLVGDVASASGLRFGDSEPADGVLLEIGQSAPDQLVVFDNSPQSTAGNAAIQGGVYDTALTDDWIFSNGNQNLNLRLSGLAAGEYEVVALVREPNQLARTYDVGIGAVSAADIGAVTLADLAITSIEDATNAPPEFADGINFAVETVTITDSTDFITIIIDPTNDAFGTISALQIVAVPEPSSTALLGLGALGFILRRRR